MEKNFKLNFVIGLEKEERFVDKLLKLFVVHCKMSMKLLTCCCLFENLERKINACLEIFHDVYEKTNVLDFLNDFEIYAVNVIFSHNETTLIHVSGHLAIFFHDFSTYAI